MDPLERRLKEMKAAHLGLQAPDTVPKIRSVRECLEEMRRLKKVCLLVVEEGRLVGIFTERDALQKVALEADSLQKTVADVMTPNPIVLEDGASVAQAIHCMHKHGFRHVPIVDEAGKPVGLVGHMDIIRFITAEFADKVLNIPPTHDQVMHSAEGG